jgi:hypothetical protein
MNAHKPLHGLVERIEIIQKRRVAARQIVSYSTLETKLAHLVAWPCHEGRLSVADNARGHSICRRLIELFPPAFEEGRAYMLHPCPSGDPEWPHRRDANPYPEGSDEHDAWDAGYISAPKDRR